MRITIAGATFLMFSAGAATVGALNNVQLRGSDTLEVITKDVLAACPAATMNGISYLGGGSTTGGSEMIADRQNVAPQSRALSAAEGCANPGMDVTGLGSQAEGIVLALDGLAIAAPTPSSCGGRLLSTVGRTVPCTVGDTGCSAGGTYSVGNSIQLLALLFAGKHNGTASNVRNCDSSARRAVVANWGNLFEDACPSGTCAGGLSRVWRRADLSGTTDTFLSLVGLSSMPLPTTAGSIARRRWVDFCNAWPGGGEQTTPTNATCDGASPPATCRYGGESDGLDNDPIQTACGANEQRCKKNGMLGLVQVADVPQTRCDPSDPTGPGLALTQAELWYLDASNNTRVCDTGVFRLMSPTPDPIPAGFLCPNDRPTLFQRCWQPVKIEGGQPNAACLALDFPVQGFQANGIVHGGVYNRILKNSLGHYVTKPRAPATGCTLALSYNDANHLIQATRVTGATGAPCTKLASATDLIGCLTQASSCSIGFAGREGLSPSQVRIVPSDPLFTYAGITGLSVNNVAPTVANIQALISGGTAYPLARKVYFNTIKGFEHADLATGERELARCMATDAIVAPIATSRNFIAVPGGVRCEDFNESGRTECGAPTSNTNACTNNAGMFCGDGVVQSGIGETCDDGNNTPADGCNATCTGV